VRASVLGRILGPMSRTLAFGLVLVSLALLPDAAGAQPFRGTGKSAPSPKDKSPTAARSRALDDARRAALEAALVELGKSVKLSKSTKKSITSSTSAWTGSYRIVSEKPDGDGVAIEVEVEVDLARLRKRTETGVTAAAVPLFSLEGVDLDSGCTSVATIRARIEDELVVAGAVGSGGASLKLKATCTVLGPVPHTFEHAARIAIVATSGGITTASAELDGFATSPEEALAAAAAQAAAQLGASLALHRRGRVLLRVSGGRPSVKLRRLERALVQSVPGVSAVELSRVDAQGRVVFSVLGVPDAQTLAQSLQSLQSPGVQTSVTTIEGPDVLAIELH
jgi:hypothetical protein